MATAQFFSKKNIGCSSLRLAFQTHSQGAQNMWRKLIQELGMYRQMFSKILEKIMTVNKIG
jgi:hypothetical protein